LAIAVRRSLADEQRTRGEKLADEQRTQGENQVLAEHASRISTIHVCIGACTQERMHARAT
jgi:hypothetical protein